MTSQEKLHVIRTDEEIDTLIGYLADKSFVSYDVETTGLHRSSEIVGMSVCADPEEAYYIITAYWDVDKKELVRLPNKAKIIELLELLLTKQLIMHNGFVDVQWTQVNYGVFLMPALFHDTMLSSHLLDENTSDALKERSYTEFGHTSVKEQLEMRQSVIDRGGIWEMTLDRKTGKLKDKKGGVKEMYKADPLTLGKYGAKDAILTLKFFYLDVPRLFDQELDKFFYEDETMPLYRGPTWDLNTDGLKVDLDKLAALEKDLTKEINDLKASILFDIGPYIQDKYPGDKKKNQFNIGSSNQLAWLLFVRLEQPWKKLTDGGRQIAKDLLGRIPYTISERRIFMETLITMKDAKGNSYNPARYIKCDKNVIADFADKYEWCKNLLKYAKANKLLKTYVKGLKKKTEYGVIHPSFRQNGTVGPRYSSSNPNFQNLPRDDKRIKACIVARPGKVFVGADQEQLEPRVFASFSQDIRLCESFAKGEDFYSVVGIPVFGKHECVALKEGPANAFGVKYPKLRQHSKTIALAITYGANEHRLSEMLRLPIEECKQIIEDYFTAYPLIRQMMLNSHKEAIDNGVVYNLFGRPRHLPGATAIKQFGVDPEDLTNLPYELRSLLNQAVNSKIQNTAGSIMNRVAIAFKAKCAEVGIDAKIKLQVHDELIVECDEDKGQIVSDILKDAMENTVTLPGGVKLVTKPKIAYNLADLK